LEIDFKMKKEIVTITTDAKKYLHHILLQHPECFIKAGYMASGCAGFKYTFEFIDKNSINFGYDLIDDILIISHEHTIGLIGSTLTLVSNKFENQLVWENPSAISECGCGESFQLDNGCNK